MLVNRDAAATPLRHDAGLASLSVVARFHGKAAEPEQLRHELGLVGAARAEDLLLAAKRLQLKARIGKADGRALERATLPLPCIIELAGETPAFAVLARIEGGKGATRKVVKFQLRPDPLAR